MLLRVVCGVFLWTNTVRPLNLTLQILLPYPLWSSIDSNSSDLFNHICSCVTLYLFCMFICAFSLKSLLLLVIVKLPFWSKGIISLGVCFKIKLVLWRFKFIFLRMRAVRNHVPRSTAKSQYHVQSRLFLYIVIAKGTIQLQLLSSIDESLIVGLNSFFVMDLHFHILSRVRGENI